MIEIKLDNNEFLRQFEVKVNSSLARIEYAEQERKIFLTKIIIPRQIYSKEFEELYEQIMDAYEVKRVERKDSGVINLSIPNEEEKHGGKGIVSGYVIIKFDNSFSSSSWRQTLT